MLFDLEEFAKLIRFDQTQFEFGFKTYPGAHWLHFFKFMSSFMQEIEILVQSTSFSGR